MDYRNEPIIYQRLSMPTLYRYCDTCRTYAYGAWYGVSREQAMAVAPDQREVVICDACGCSEHGDRPAGVVTATGRTLQTFLTHRALAAAWVRYNSRSGRSTEKQESRVMRQLSISDLERMLGERGVAVAR